MKQLLLILLLVFSLTGNSQNSILSLAGQWNFKLDPQNIGEKENWHEKQFSEKIKLPGTTDEAGYGEKTTGSDYGILTRKFKYIGAAWYQREIIIPKESGNKNFELLLERVLWESKVWIDGKLCDVQDGLGVPHIHTTGKLAAGKHILTIRVNNDMIYNIGDKGHTYSEYTQSIWNGIVGRMELAPVNPLHISRLKTWPDATKQELKVTFDIANDGNSAKVNLQFKLIELTSNETVFSKSESISCKSGINSYSSVLIPDKPVKLWDEFSPNLYRLVVETKSGKAVETTSADFGFRSVSTSKSKIQINNKPVFLRGNLDCVHFPITGYPSCDPLEWERIFRIYKEYGLNHVRFHSWCPPEAAFIAADRLGIYIQAEILWIDWWMTSAPKDRPDMLTKGLPEGLGKNPSADAYVQSEMQRIADTYGNHPSFIMFCIGNELGNSDFSVMEKWIVKMKELDNRRLYSVSTARKIMPADQYMVTHNIPGVGGTYGVKGNTTDYDLEANYSKSGIPVIAHEVGQYPVYPLWSEIEKYTGVLKARNLEECKESARKNNLLEMNSDFQSASGSLQNLLYKAHIENFFRTPSCAGFQMLSMCDYQGQGEALVGWLDCFWDAKGNTTPDGFRQYCNTIVPLARFKKFVWETTETFYSTLQIANYGPGNFSGNAVWSLASDNGRIIEQGNIQNINVIRGEVKEISKVNVQLSKIKKAGKYNFNITLEGTEYSNSWGLWVYPPVKINIENVTLATEISPEVESILDKGGKVLLIASNLGTSESSKPLFFTPLFWSTVFFPGQTNSTLGLFVNKNHPALKEFPTENFSNYQWAEISKGKSFVLNNCAELKPISQPISDFHINDKLGSIFECKTGKGKLLVCGYDISDENNPVSRQMKYSLLQYMNQCNFNPVYTLEFSELKKMLFYVQPVVSQTPAGFEKALIYVQSGGNMKKSGSESWNINLDKSLAKSEKVNYQVKCTDTWKDEKGTAWTGTEMTISIQTPAGITGDLFVKFTDQNIQNREGSIWFEGREMKLGQHKGDSGKWIKIFVMREDTNDGEIVLKTRATKGGNLMISEMGLIAE